MAFEAPYILHMFTPGRQMSPFDINMAADAGYQMVVPYSDVGLDNVTALTQDTIFSRGPKGVARTGIFIGGRDAMVAADMTDRAVASMVPPFSVSVMADPSGGYTTAAAMVACVEAAVLKVDPKGLAGQRMLIIGAGPVGRIAGVLAAQAGAEVRVSSHRGLDAANRAAQETNQRFGVSIGGVSGADAASLRVALHESDLVLACAAAGLQVATAEDMAGARRLKVAADVNAVPPEGLAGVGVMDKGKPIPGTGAVGWGALAIGNVKYQTQHRLLVQMRESTVPLKLSFDEAFQTARAFLAESAAGKS